MASTIQEHLLRCGAVRFGEFKLTSGATSEYYVDVKKALCDPAALRDMAVAIADLAHMEGPFDAVAGMELGAVPLATAVSLQADLPLLMVRKGERGHGTGKRIEGMDVAGRNLLVVEDVATSGGSTVEAIQVLREAGADVSRAIVVVDRQSGATEALKQIDVTLESLVTAEGLLAARPEASA